MSAGGSPWDTPDDVTIEPEPDLAREIDRRILARSTVRLVSVTDLVDPRPAYHREKHPVPVSPEREARMADGRRRHERTERLLAAPVYREIRVVRDGIVGRIDIFEDQPTEVKSTGSLPDPLQIVSTRPQYVDQLGMYCALVDRAEGRLVLIEESEAHPPPFLVLSGRFGDLEEVRRRMGKLAQSLRQALAASSPESLPRCGWYGRGCEFQQAGVCGCTGREPELDRPVRELLVGLRADPVEEAQIRARLGQIPGTEETIPLRTYRELLYPRRAYFTRVGPPTDGPSPAAAPSSAQGPEGPSLFQLVREALEEGAPGELVREVPEGDVPEEQVLLYHGVPLLLKTTRTPWATPAEELPRRQPNYVVELGLRCAALGRSEGVLLIGYERLTREERSLRAYRLRFGSTERWVRSLKERQALLRSALAKQDPSGLPACPSWMFENCPYRSTCGDGPSGPTEPSLRQR